MWQQAPQVAQESGELPLPPLRLRVGPEGAILEQSESERAMKFLYWSVGVMQILTGFMLAWSIAPGWKWLWITAAVYWFFVGCVFGVAALFKLTAGKIGAGVSRGSAGGRPHTPAPTKEG